MQGCNLAIIVLSAIAGCTPAITFGQSPGNTTPSTLDAVTAESVKRAPALLGVAARACEAISKHASLSTYEIESDIRTTLDLIDTEVRSADDLPRAQQRLVELEARIGELDTVPSLDLQLTLATLAKAAGDDETRTQRRAFNLALMSTISASGDGISPTTAYQPCLVSNEPYFLRAVKGAKTISEQSLQPIGDRRYDRITIVRNDDSTEAVFFDVSEAFASQRSKKVPRRD